MLSVFAGRRGNRTDLTTSRANKMREREKKAADCIAQVF